MLCTRPWWPHRAHFDPSLLWKEKSADRPCSGLCTPLRGCHFPVYKNVQHAISMYVEEADLIQQELTTEVVEATERCTEAVCAPQPRPPSLCNNQFSL